MKNTWFVIKNSKNRNRIVSLQQIGMRSKFRQKSGHWFISENFAVKFCYVQLLFPVTNCDTANTWISLLQTLSGRFTEILKDLEIYHIFTHSDKQVYAHLCQTIWKEPTEYQTAIMGSFHQLRVRQKTIFKQHIMSYRVWLTDAGGSWFRVYWCRCRG